MILTVKTTVLNFSSFAINCNFSNYLNNFLDLEEENETTEKYNIGQYSHKEFNIHLS